ncbi:MAG TPA: SDR family oxidoreductase [Acidimicrobiales bacterium]|nr:SDR family oxidoreductase [Acidimicrobiales bacterium]
MHSTFGGRFDGRFDGKVVLVAGAARPPGLGFALARRFAAGGATVACVDAVGDQPAAGHDTGVVPPGLLEELTAEVAAIAATGGRSDAAAGGGGSDAAAGGGNDAAAAGGAAPGTAAFPVDPADPADWARAAVDAIDTFGRVDIACPFMGTTGPAAGDGRLMDVPLDAWQRCYDVNVTAPLLFGRACAADMVARGAGGALCFLSSYSAVVPPVGFGAVASARAALNRVVEVLAAELGPDGIRVNAVQPLSVRNPDGRFPNPGLQGLATSEAPGLERWVRDHLPLGRPQSPDETAAVAAFLCSDQASFVTGLSVPVAGGAHAHS